jgi:hypothetical protein
MMKSKMALILCSFFLMSALTGCGGGTSASLPPPGEFQSPVISSLSPSSVVAGSQKFSLVVTGKYFTQVRRFPDQGSYQVIFNGHSLQTATNSDTQLTATVPPEEIRVTGAVTVSLQTTDIASNTIMFNIVTQPGFSILPPSDSLGPKGQRLFVARSTENAAPVTWSVREGSAGGSVTPDGLYTAPLSGGIFHVVATSTQDTSETAIAEVSVLASGFTETGSIHIARSGHTATLLADGKVLIAGGGVAGTEVFDPGTGKFTAAGDMALARYGATATLLANGKVLVTGGCGTVAAPDGHLPRLTSAELYDPSTGTFTATGSMNFPRILHTATLLNDGRVLIAGGTVDSGGGGAASETAELYDVPSGAFTPTASMSSERANHTATLLASGKVLIVGGWNGHAADSSDDPPWDPLFAELLDPSSGTFASTGSMSTTRIGHSAVRVADGNVLVLGGIPSIENIHEQLPDPRYAESYSPASGTFSSAGSFALSSTGYTATLLKNGFVLVAGGQEDGIAATSAALLDPGTSSLTPTGGLVTARAGHTATLLNDGRVLVTGGTDANGNELASAELYQ